MTYQKAVRYLSTALLILALAPPAAAESTPEATEWLQKLMAIYEKGPFRVGFSANIDMSAAGQSISGTLTGQVTQKDRTHTHSKMEMVMAGMPGTTTGPITMKMLSIADGTTIWTEMENPAVGGTQVTKLAIADLEKVAQSMGGLSPASMDPVAQLEALTTTMDFEVLEENGNEVTLRGRMTDATRAKVGALAAPGVDAFIFVFDAGTGFPKEVRAEGETAFMTLLFEELEFLDAATLPDELFQYTPAEGLPVMDLGAMLSYQAIQ